MTGFQSKVVGTLYEGVERVAVSNAWTLDVDDNGKSVDLKFSVVCDAAPIIAAGGIRVPAAVVLAALDAGGVKALKVSCPAATDGRLKSRVSIPKTHAGMAHAIRTVAAMDERAQNDPHFAVNGATAAETAAEKAAAEKAAADASAAEKAARDNGTKVPAGHKK